jgi:hypothetical protein
MMLTEDQVEEVAFTVLLTAMDHNLAEVRVVALEALVATVMRILMLRASEKLTIEAVVVQRETMVISKTVMELLHGVPGEVSPNERKIEREVMTVLSVHHSEAKKNFTSTTINLQKLIIKR